MSRWFRSYADTHRNPKVARLSDSDFRLWHQLLCMAAENDGVLPPAKDIKLVLNRRLDHLLEALKRLISGGLIDPLGDGYAPRNWDKRQYKSDTSTPRVQEHRAKRNVSETSPETEADTETDKPKPIGLVKKRHPIPENWEAREFAHGTESRKVIDGWPPGELGAQFEQFMAHHRSKRNTFLDPQDAWSTWVLNTRKWGIGKNERSSNPTADAVHRILGSR